MKTYRRHIERFRAFIRRREEQPIGEQTNERLLAPGDPEAVLEFASRLQGDVKEGRMSVSSYNVLIAAISSFYKHWSQPTLRASSGIPSTPVPSKLQMRKQPRKAKALSHAQLESVVHGARRSRSSASPSRDALIIRLVYWLGTRATETINLRWADVIQLESGPAVHVRAENAKGKKERFIPIDAVVLELFEELKAQPESEWCPQPEAAVEAPRQGLWKLSHRAGEAATEVLDPPAPAPVRRTLTPPP